MNKKIEILIISRLCNSSTKLFTLHEILKTIYFRPQNKKKRAAASQGANRKGHEKDGKDKKHEKSNDRLTVTREATAKDRQNDNLTTRAVNSGNLTERSESVDDSDR